MTPMRRFLVAACAWPALTLPQPALAATVRVFAAASLQDVFRLVGERFEAAHPGTTLEFNFAGSQVLRTQIEQGAEADLFASADTEHVAALARAGLVDSPAVFAHNRLVVVTSSHGSRVGRLEDLALPGVRLVMAGPAVPAGRYADEALRRLGRDPRFGAARERAARANVVSLESNVRAVLAKVDLGEADAGFVYETDARWMGGGGRPPRHVIDLPPEDEVIASYVIARVRGARHGWAAAPFERYLLGRDGQAVLAVFFFRP